MSKSVKRGLYACMVFGLALVIAGCTTPEAKLAKEKAKLLEEMTSLLEKTQQEGNFAAHVDKYNELNKKLDEVERELSGFGDKGAEAEAALGTEISGPKERFDRYWEEKKRETAERNKNRKKEVVEDP
jgi:hypothetical protein